MRAFVIFAMLFLIRNLAFTQVIENLDILHDQYTFEKSKMNSLNPQTYSSIEGSPFLSKDFVKGEVIINDTIHYKDVPLRYNIYTDKMEFLDNQDVVREVTTADHKFIFKLNGQSFKLLQYNDGRSVKKGMLELIVDGPTCLYRRYSVDLTEATPPMGYQAARPARFSRNRDEFFVATQGRLPVLITRKRDLIQRLQEVNPDINQYLQDNKLQIKSEESLIAIIEYTNNHNE